MIYSVKYDVETVKATADIPRCLELYAGISARHGKGRCKCPIHGGDNNNFSYDLKRFHCFVCGASGDSISFVQHFFNLSFCDALEKLGRDFGIAPGVDPAVVAKRQVEILARRERERSEKENFRKFTAAYRRLKDAPPSEMRDYFLSAMSKTIDEMIACHNADDYDVDSILRMIDTQLSNKGIRK